MSILIVAVLIGLLPAAIAQSKGRNFLWWWIYGTALFIIATPHALMLDASTKKCPHCAEFVKPEATVCKHCQSNLRVCDAIAELDKAIKHTKSMQGGTKP